jgi:microcystin-dependent protein
MIVIENEYPNTTPASAAYPYGSAKNVSAPGDTDGTPWELKDINDILGMMQKIVVEGAVTPSGVPETVLASDIFDALEKTFNRVVAHTDAGSANVYVLNNVNAGKQTAAYSNSDILVFKIANANTSASTCRIGTLGVKSFTEPDGSALAPGRLPAGGYAIAKYDSSNDRIELISVTTAAPSNDIGKLRLWGGTIASIPVDEFICDGAEYSETTYAALFAKIGTTWNTGGETAGFFRVPDFTNRVALHADGVSLDPGDTGGTKNTQDGVDLVAAHVHGTDNDTHAHTADGQGNGTVNVGNNWAGGQVGNTNDITVGMNTDTHSHTTNSQTNSGTWVPKYAAAPWIIKAF